MASSLVRSILIGGLPFRLVLPPAWGLQAAETKPAELSRILGLCPEYCDKLNGAVLKIEGEQTSLGNYQQALEIAKALGAEPKIEFTSEYEFEKNGLCFPSRYAIKDGKL